MTHIHERDDDPLVPDMIEQYDQVLDNIMGAETPADIPDPIDAAPVDEPTQMDHDHEPAAAPDPVEVEARDWERDHPDGPF